MYSVVDGGEAQLDAWGDLRIGDRVCLRNRPAPGFEYTGRELVLVELLATTAPISGDPDALAVIRDARGETYTVNVRLLRRV